MRVSALQTIGILVLLFASGHVGGATADGLVPASSARDIMKGQTGRATATKVGRARSESDSDVPGRRASTSSRRATSMRSRSRRPTICTQRRRWRCCARASMSSSRSRRHHVGSVTRSWWERRSWISYAPGARTAGAGDLRPCSFCGPWRRPSSNGQLVPTVNARPA
jgi:hypothetical protein